MREKSHHGVWLGVCVLGASGLLVGCQADSGSKPPSDFCKAVDSLTATMTEVNQNPLTRESLATVKASTDAIMSGVDNVEATTESEFSDQVDAVSAAATDFDNAMTAAADQPNSSTVEAARTSLGQLTGAVDDLSKSTSQSC